MKQKLTKTVTIREIETAGPCAGQYAAFLNDFKSMPVPDGAYAFLTTPEGHRGGDLVVKKRRTPQHGPDDQIKLTDILARKKTTGYDSGERVGWLLACIPSLRAINAIVAERRDEIKNGAYMTALLEVLGE